MNYILVFFCAWEENNLSALFDYSFIENVYRLSCAFILPCTGMIKDCMELFWLWLAILYASDVPPINSVSQVPIGKECCCGSIFFQIIGVNPEKMDILVTRWFLNIY